MFCLSNQYLVARIYTFASIADTSLEVKAALDAHCTFVGSYSTTQFQGESSYTWCKCKSFMLPCFDHEYEIYVLNKLPSVVVHGPVTGGVTGLLINIYRSHSSKGTELSVSQRIGNDTPELSLRRITHSFPWVQSYWSCFSLLKPYACWNHLVPVWKYWSAVCMVVLSYLWGLRPNRSSRMGDRV